MRMLSGGAVTPTRRDMLAAPLLTLALLSAQVAAGAAMKGLKVKVPRVAYIGDDAELECNFPGADTTSLYSIKWWRDNDQFYQYIPKHKEPKMQFNVFGIKVDPQNSTEFKVSLKDLTANSSGVFTCEVILDDNFETLRESANMTVIDPPDRNTAGKYGPSIEVEGWSGVGPLEIRDGELLEAVCVARGANPPVDLAWYFNGSKAPSELVRPQSRRWEGRNNTYTSALRLVFSADEMWDEQGRLDLKCKAVIPGIFSESASLVLHNPIRRRTQLSGLFADGSRLAASSCALAACVLSAVLLQYLPQVPLGL
ncbi:uncharacterized protein LOC122258305 [Penaeus japonicus]|uniref:uncharacterized protein LOC122258305 n=1 Tax=Penaeus japonicus TaxID=27405 RepID=UPI001C7129B1|nr:uncharacterized protein LOC122258305 [Penaeus japonicus]